MKQADTQKKPFSTKTAIVIVLCIVLVATVAIIGAHWNILSLFETSAPSESSQQAEDTLQTENITPDDGQVSVSNYPWENGGKQPEEYLYSEYLALSAEQQSAFSNTFESADAFTTWQRSAIERDDSLNLPWQGDGKQPDDYTWEDFLALSDAEKDIFYLAFPSTDAYHQWEDRVAP